MSAGGGGQTTTDQKSNTHLPGFEQPLAKGYLSALAGLVFPGMQMPANYLPKGWDFNSSSGGAGGGGTAGAAGQIPTQGLDPSLAYQLMNPIIGSSPSLQNAYAQNPGAITSAMSPASFNQLGQIYGNMGLA